MSMINVLVIHREVYASDTQYETIQDNLNELSLVQLLLYSAVAPDVSKCRMGINLNSGLFLKQSSIISNHELYKSFLLY